MRRQPLHQVAQVQFGVATTIFALTWLFGLSLRTNIWEVDIEWVRRSGISSILRGGVSDLFSVAFVIAVSAATYAWVLIVLRRDFAHRFLFAVAGSIIVALAALPTTPLTSPDTTHFAADVRTLWLFGRDPTDFDNVPEKIDDPVAQEVRTYRGAPSGYGIVAYGIGGAPLPFVGDSLRANIFGQKVLSGTMLILTGLAAGLVARRLGRNPALVMASIAMNPMFVWQFPGDGHNDIIMAAFATIALCFLIDKSWSQRSAGVALAVLSVMTKYSVVIVSPIVLVSWFPRYRRIIGALVAGGGLLAVITFFGIFKPSIATIGPLEGVTRNTPWSYIFEGFDLSGGPHDFVLAVCYSGAVLAIGAICFLHKFEEEQDMIDAIALALAIFLFFFAPTLRQWYLIWGYPIVMLSSRRWLRYGAVAFSLCGFLPTLALNWQITIARDIGISYPVQIAVAMAWLLTMGFTSWRYYGDKRPRRSTQNSRAARRAAPNAGRKRMTAR